ncbi:hypothetical protein IFM12276_58230 [Nocardia sputorum]|uniref:DUF397 domain-containing protein n=1 Tax=Nocardia sputorum TaxID=2984338 RepID=A0ABM8D5T5_9NOCA|nr:hypothetical protein IFM12276_58230 [Nocardia sputorum]
MVGSTSQSEHASPIDDAVGALPTTEPAAVQEVHGTGGDCVEVAHLDGGMVGVRDSKDPTGPALVFTPGAWDAVISGVQYGQFHPPA